MRTESEIRLDLERARGAYQQARADNDLAATEAHSAAAKAYMAELSAVLAEGAGDCRAPGHGAPAGMLRRPGLYEVGCLTCPARAFGTTAAAAVEGWNRQLEDAIVDG